MAPDDRIVHEVIQTFVLLIEECKVRLFRKVVEEVEKGEAGHANAIFEHVDAQSLVEIERRRAVIAPRLSTAKSER